MGHRRLLEKESQGDLIRREHSFFKGGIICQAPELSWRTGYMWSCLWSGLEPQNQEKVVVRMRKKGWQDLVRPMCLATDEHLLDPITCWALYSV